MSVSSDLILNVFKNPWSGVQSLCPVVAYIGSHGVQNWAHVPVRLFLIHGFWKFM